MLAPKYLTGPTFTKVHPMGIVQFILITKNIMRYVAPTESTTLIKMLIYHVYYFITESCAYTAAENNCKIYFNKSLTIHTD